MLLPFLLHAQSPNDSAQKRIYDFDGPSAAMLKKTAAISENMQRHVLRSLNNLQRREERLKIALSKRDSLAGAKMGDPKARYDSLRQLLVSRQQKLCAFTNLYDGKLDSLKTAFKFLDESGTGNYDGLLNQYDNLQHQFNQTDKVQAYLTQRQDQLFDQVSRIGQLRSFRKYQQEIVYYKNTMASYKQLWDHPDQIEQKVLGVVAKVPAFRNFFGSNSDLAAVFRQPGLNASVDPSALSSGLQTRQALDKFFESAGGGSLQAQVQQGIHDAGGASGMTSQLQSISDVQQPKSQKPEPKINPYHGRPFWQRLEKGFNVQSLKSTSFLPATSDLAASIGYKFTPYLTAGFGAGGKIGWGESIRKIQVSAQGISIRSYLDGKIAGSFYVTGGWEFNYQPVAVHWDDIHKMSDWKQSALLGITKKFPIGSKLFKNYNVSLLYDFLYRNTLPVTSPFKFRIGYSL